MDENIVRLADEGNISALTQTLDGVKLEEVSLFLSALASKVCFHCFRFQLMRSFPSAWGISGEKSS